MTAETGVMVVIPAKTDIQGIAGMQLLNFNEYDHHKILVPSRVQE
jgi:hypothetical protein